MNTLKPRMVLQLCVFVFFLSLVITPMLWSNANYPYLGGNDNYLFYGNYSTINVASNFYFSGSLSPNQFSTQVNTYIAGTCNGNLVTYINYQSVVRTGPNGENQFSMDYLRCATTNNVYAFDILPNVDLSAAGVNLYYWFNYNGNNQVTSSEVQITGYGSCGCGSDTFIIYVSNIPQGQDEITSEYQHILVGSALQNNGQTTFTGGYGTIDYYSGLSGYSSMYGIVYDYSGESSNSIYASPSVLGSGSYYQDWQY